MIRSRHSRTPLAVPPADEASDDQHLLRLRRSHDGYHWVSVDGLEEFGPYGSLEQALADMDRAPVGAIEPCKTVEAAEQGCDAPPGATPEGDEPETAS